MANHVSPLKRTRQIERRTAINRARKTRLRHQIRAMRQLISANDGAGARKALPGVYSIIDRAAKWGVIKANTAARYKSRLAVRLSKLTG
jgi:small subunit ribosomal protein S20